jgi:hypothetical protein
VVNPADDYTDFVVPLARAVAAGKLERDVAICGSGVGRAGSSLKEGNMRNRTKFLLNLALLGFTLGCAYSALQRRWNRPRGKQATGM